MGVIIAGSGRRSTWMLGMVVSGVVMVRVLVVRVVVSRMVLAPMAVTPEFGTVIMPAVSLGC